MTSFKIPLSVLFLASIALFGTQRNRDNLDSLSVRFSYLTTSERIILNLLPLLGIVVLIFFHSRINKLQVIFSHKINLNVFWALGFILIFSANFSWTPYIFNKVSRIYSWIGIGHLRPGFADWLGVLKGIDSVTEPGESFIIDCPGSCMQYRWQYPSLLLKLNFIENLSAYVGITAFFIFLLFVIQFIKVYNFLNAGTFVGILFILSPPFILLYERMNPEIILLILTPFLARHIFNEKRIIIAIFIIFVMSEVKFYPIILFVFLILAYYRKWKYFLIVFVGLVTVSILILQDLHLVGSNNLIAGYAATFGLIGLTSFAQGLPEPMLNFQQIPIVFAVAIFLLYFLFLGTRIKVQKLKNERYRYFETLFLISSSLFIFSWLTNSNYIYRASLLVWIIPFFIILYTNNSKIILFWFVVTLVGCFTLPVTLAPIRNILFSVSASIMTGLFLVVVRNLFVKGGLNSNLKVN